MGTNNFDLTSLTLLFDLLLKTLTLALSFEWYVVGLSLIVHMVVPLYDKTFLWIPTDLTL
jgi:hypothetical protein